MGVLEPAELDGHADFVVSAAFSADRARFVTSSFDDTAKLWDVHLEERSPQEIAELVAKNVNWQFQDGSLFLA